MAIWSRFLLSTRQKLPNSGSLLKNLLPKNNGNTSNVQQGIVRSMSGHHMHVTPSRWQWHKTKDWMHFYFFVGAIPVAIIVFCANVFIGPATLEPIPEGYIPKPWEYHRSPISRFLARYVYANHQQEYEKYLHYLEVANEKRKILELQTKVNHIMRQYGDYKFWTYKRDLRAKQILEIRKMYDDGSFVK